MMINQETFDPLDYGSRDEARKAKNSRVKELRAQGFKVVSSILKNQLRKYSGFGCPDGSVRDVFMISIFEA